MEDEHLATDLAIGSAKQCMFAVFDGHGGRDAARFCVGAFPPVIMERLRGHEDASSSELEESFFQAFFDVDKMIAQADRDKPGKYLRVGCTAVLAFVSERGILIGNAGDSRAVLSRGGTSIIATEDHKPILNSEAARVHKAGGFVKMQQIGNQMISRIDGKLAVSRAMGDLAFKGDPSLSACKQKVICMPDVQFIERKPWDEFLVLACDGIWDVLTNQQVVDMVRAELRAKTSHPDIVRKVVDRCVARDSSQLVGKDNMTMILVVFEQRGVQSEDTAYKSCPNQSDGCCFTQNAIKKSARSSIIAAKTTCDDECSCLTSWFA
jgi:serine/threonine protein phosphatase PrpC